VATKQDKAEKKSDRMSNHLKQVSTKQDVLEIKNELVEVKEHLGNVDVQMNSLKEENKALREQLEELKKARETDRIEISRLVEEAKKKNVIFKGLQKSEDLKKSVELLCKETLGVQNIHVRLTRTLFEDNGKLGLLAVMQTEEMAAMVFKNAKKLEGSSISIDRDLTTEKQQHKRVLLQLKKMILDKDKTKKITVRNDTIKIGEHFLFWNRNKELRCGKKCAKDVLRALYGSNIDSICLNYNQLLNIVMQKN